MIGLEEGKGWQREGRMGRVKGLGGAGIISRASKGRIPAAPAGPVLNRGALSVSRVVLDTRVYSNSSSSNDTRILRRLK